MNKAIGIATQARTTKLVRTGVVPLIVTLLLAACGGGAQTTANPAAQAPGNGNNNSYTGPVARDADVLKFQQEFWSNAKTTDRCGNCHNETVGQLPMFVRNDDVNMAYDAALTKVNLLQPSQSEIVAKVSSTTERHNCWVQDPGVCGSIMTTWIENWAGDTAGGGRQIVLTPPTSQAVLPSKNFPATSTAFEQIIYTPILQQYCSGCHSSDSATAQQPYFADVDVNAAYEAAQAKMNLDSPVDSRFVIKVSPNPMISGESHNCWNNDCATAEVEMLAAITAFANGITPTVVDPTLITSKAIRLIDGTLASGGNRYEDAQIALWEFQTGNGLTAFDTSGVDPAIDLDFFGDVTWYGGWGITIGSDMAQGPGKVQASSTGSKKLHDVLKESGEFSIEAWVVPANVTQEMAQIISFSAGPTTRNFALQQTLYDYDFLLRHNAVDANDLPLMGLNGEPAHSTPAMDEVLQATLQHVVATYNPIDGRKIYVNGALVSATDPIPGGTLVDWQDNFAVILGNEASNDGLWTGTFRLAAVHRRALTQAQITQNFDAGVGERFYMLFDISERIGAPVDTSFILFEAEQFDTYGYLFNKPHFTTLDGVARDNVTIKGLHLAMNSQEVSVGQSYANMDQSTDAAQNQELGQPLSVLGAVIPLEKGPKDDLFFLTFDDIDGVLYNRPEAPMLVLSPQDTPDASSIGVRTFDEIDATYAAVLEVDRLMVYTTNGVSAAHVDETYQELRQSLPAVEDINTFLSSHQVAIAQLAIQYCDAAIGSNASPNPRAEGVIWTLFDFDLPAATAFSAANRQNFVNPLIARAVGQTSGGPQLLSQPSYAIVYDEAAAFGGAGGRPANLIDRLLAGTSDTRAIAKGVCASVLGSAATLVQ
ncbi:MAG: LamG domain-containing protein [Woeseiaceae bacterium]|nr:LamG domain-containing protein [Woeseiaceae bacterium]